MTAIVDRMASGPDKLLVAYYQLFMRGQKKLGIPDSLQYGKEPFEQTDIALEGANILKKYGRFTWAEFDTFWFEGLRYLQKKFANDTDAYRIPKLNDALIREMLNAVVTIHPAPPENQIESAQDKMKRKQKEEQMAKWSGTPEELTAKQLPLLISVAEGKEHERHLINPGWYKVWDYMKSQMDETTYLDLCKEVREEWKRIIQSRYTIGDEFFKDKTPADIRRKIALRLKMDESLVPDIDTVFRKKLILAYSQTLKQLSHD